VHKLLARQIRAAKREDGEIDLPTLIGIIDQAYGELDRERRLNDRAAKLMEDELIAANEQAMREHDAVLATILASAPDGMLVTALGGIVETANAAAERQFRAQPGGLAGRRLNALLPVDAAQWGAASLDLSGGRTTGEAHARTIDGTDFPVEYSISPLGTGSSVKQLWIVRDISERIHAQRAISESRLRFQDFAEASSDSFWEMDKDLRTVEASAWGGRKNAEIIVRILTGKPAPEAANGDDGRRWLHVLNKIASHEAFRALRVSVTQENGERLEVSLSGKPIFDGLGNFSGYRGTARDITEAVLAREAARRAQLRMFDAMNAAPNAVALVDASMNFVAGNSALSALAPDAASELEAGTSFPHFLGRAFAPQGTLESELTEAELLHGIIQSGKPYELHAGNKWLLIAGRRVSDQGAVLTFSDVTDIKERERELAEAKKAAESANRLKSQFLATMSHELRTPLNAILGFSEVIRDQVLGREGEAWRRYVDYAGSIHASGRHLLSLISEILDLSKIEAGTYFLDLKPLDITELVKETVSFIRPTAARAGVEIRTQIPDTPVTFLGDDRALRQIALNLLSNATKFTPRKGSVDITLTTHSDGVRLVVQDTGIGIAEDDQAAVFEPFTQVDSSVRRRHEGTGLGLAITKRLVEMHEGKIRLTSQLDIGTRLEIELPNRLEAENGSLSEVAA